MQITVCNPFVTILIEYNVLSTRDRIYMSTLLSLQKASVDWSNRSHGGGKSGSEGCGEKPGN